MEAIPKQVEVYETPGGKQPFNEWLDSLKDKRIEISFKLKNTGKTTGVNKWVKV